jgi:murein DD-endopeptidase MepM/ murein hydrolase activator NlpD
VTLAALALVQAALTATAASEHPPSVRIIPGKVRPGDAFLVVVREATSPPAASVAGRALAFFQVPEGFAAVAALPVEIPAGKLAVPVALQPGTAAAAGSSAIEGSIEVAAAAFTRRELTVDPGYVKPRPPDVQRRIEEDRAAFASAFAQPDAPPLFASPFALPRRARVTAGFGERRTLNGVMPSQHYGIDLAGKVGAPVTASNAGKVVLVRDCWASGMSVVLWHGANLYTTYLHLSRVSVGLDAHVARGELIGLVGKSGRASGPHLHWGVRVGDLYVDPASVLRLPLGGRVSRGLQPAPAP